MILLASIAVGALMSWALFRAFFDDLADLVDCLRLYFTPEIINAFRGEWHEGNWAFLKVLIYFGVCIGSGFMTHYSLGRLYGQP